MADSSDNEEYTCADCGRSFDSEQGLHVHQGQKGHEGQETSDDEQEQQDEETTLTVEETQNAGTDTPRQPRDSGIDIHLSRRQFGLLMLIGGVFLGAFFVMSANYFGGGTVGLPTTDNTENGNGQQGQVPTEVVDPSTTSFPYDNVDYGMGSGTLDWRNTTVNVDGRPYIGAADAPVTMVTYEDFFCPYCNQQHTETFPQLIENYVSSGDVKIYYKYFPVVGGTKPAIATECAVDNADEPAKAFWLFTYNNYDNFETMRNLFQQDEELYDETMVHWAEQFGVDSQAFQECYENQGTQEALQSQSNEAQSLGATATPWSFVNGQSLRGAQPFNAFQQVIDGEL